MSASEAVSSPQRVALLGWTASIGAVTAGSLADHQGCSVQVARGRLAAAERDGLVRRTRPLVDQPSLYTATRAGIRMAGLEGVEPTRVSAAGARHAIACAEVAAALARGYPGHVVSGERALRRDERLHGGPLASADLLGGAHRVRGRLHRPDLVLWPTARCGGLPIAVEVELTAKAPSRLLEICHGWARCRCVTGVLYVAGLQVQRGLSVAIGRARAERSIVVVGLDAIVGSHPSLRRQPESPVAGAP
jgi:hypothetical protein